jgi:acyl-CoA synthetase (NDP forming)
VLQSLVQTLRTHHPDTLLAVSTLCPPERRDALEALGCLVFSDPGAAIRCIGVLARLHETPQALPAMADTGSTLHLPAGTLSEQRSMALLAEAGVPVVPHRLVRTAAEAAQAVQEMGGPIALKVCSDAIAHKSDVGGVALNLADAAGAQAAFDRILANARQARPDATIDGALAAPMVQGGVECIAGVHRDPVFGPVLMFGLGGIHAEILRDVSLRLAGLAQRAGATLDSAEINPLIARPREHGGCMAVDALVIGREAA